MKLRLCLLLLVPAVCFAGTEEPALSDRKPWTPEISVQLRYFSLNFAHPENWPEPGPRHGEGILFSPDHQSFLFLDYGGDLRNDTTVARLQVFATAAVRTALEANARTVAPIQTLEMRSRSSYWPAMQGVHWDDDGSGVIFTGVTADLTLAAYRFDLATGTLRELAAIPRKWGERAGLHYEFQAGNLVSMATIPEPVSPEYPAQWLPRATGTAHGPSDGRSLLINADQPAAQRVIGYAACEGRPAHPIAGMTTRARLLPGCVAPKGGRAIIALARQPTDETSSIRVEDYQLVDLRSATLQRVGQVPKGKLPRPVWSPDGRWVLLLMPDPAAADVPHLCLLDATELKTAFLDVPTSISRTAFRARWLSPVSLLLADDQGIPDAGSVFTFSSGRWEARPATAEELAALTPKIADPGFAVAVQQDLNTPARVIASSGTHEIVLAEPDPLLMGVKRGRWREFVWKEADGREMRGVIMLPTGNILAGLPPLVIQPYSLLQPPNGDYRPFFRPDGLNKGGDAAAQALAASGFAVAWIDAWSNGAGSPAEGEAFVARVDAVIVELAQGKLIDPSRVGITGFPRGGYMSLFAATHPGHQPINAFICLDNFKGSIGREMQSAAEFGGSGLCSIWGSFFENRAVWMKNDTMTNADRVRAPVLFTGNIEGESRSNQMLMDELTLGSFVMAKRPYDYLLFPDGVHLLERPRERLFLMNAIVDWMRFWLKGEIPSDPERAARWAILRKQQDEVLKTPPPPKGNWVFVPEAETANTGKDAKAGTKK